MKQHLGLSLHNEDSTANSWVIHHHHAPEKECMATLRGKRVSQVEGSKPVNIQAISHFHHLLLQERILARGSFP